MSHGTLMGRWIVVLCCVAVASFQALAQTSARKGLSTQETSRARALSRNHDAGFTEQIQRTTAISIISSLVNESERYEDQTLRVRTQARSADALWNFDEVLARNLFLQAWKTAERVDEASEQSAEEARKNALRSRVGGVTMISPPANLRSEVLALAARRDAALGNMFIARLDEEKKQEAEGSEQKKAAEYLDPTEPRLAIAKRLEVALQILNAGDVEQAKAFAEPALIEPTSPGIIFLCALRQKDAVAADKLYSRLLTRAASNPDAEATTVSLLSSYILTPNYLVTATRRGRVSNQFSEPTPGYNPSPELRARFFSVAASILLRPAQPADQDSTLAGRAGTYFTIARLLPMFEVYASSYVPALKNQLAILAMDAPETFRNGQESMLRVGLIPDTPGREALADILDQLKGAASSGERDTLYVKAIREGVTKGDPQIREFAGKIEDDKLRERARSFADLAVVQKAIIKKDVEAALRIVREGYLVPLHRVWALAQIGRLKCGTNLADALQFFDEADAEAHRIALGDPDRVYALACVAASFLMTEHARSWSVVPDVVKSANAVPGFTGEDARLSAKLRTRNIISMINADEPSFNVAKLFELLAADDLQLALSTANGLSGEASRAAATLAIARAILDKQQKRTVRK